MSLTLL
ncbi:hypothetical protein M8C21_031745 [Ambrosia artemisiifolia]|nr:hypothetical protein M8C21_031745 [Ambrosia artemisiifolia]